VKIHFSAIVCILLMCAGVGAQDPNPRMSKLAWISGCWKGSGKAQKEEQWTKLAGGTMFGVGRTIKDGQTTTFDFLEIREKGPEILLIAHPDGGEAAFFKLGTVSDTEAVFENDKVQFPRKIRYQKQADGSLLIAIEGREGRTRRYDYPMQRVKCD
jgi:uncharacterized protein DUF6265